MKVHSRRFREHCRSSVSSECHLRRLPGTRVCRLRAWPLSGGYQWWSPRRHRQSAVSSRGGRCGTAAVSSVISAVVVWFAVSAFFFACLKFVGYAECSYKQVLEVCGYVSAILIVQSVFTGLVSLIGAAPAVLLLLFEGVFLLWSIPVWYFGFASVCNIDEKKLRLSVAVPVIVMAVITSAGVILAL